MEAQTKTTQEMFNKKLENLKKKQMSYTVIEMKNIVEGINSTIS